MRITAVPLAIIAAALLGACAGAPKEIPSDLSSQELIQRAQEASDSYRYEAALAYYRALVERYESSPSLVVAGEYEIAFIAYKQRRYAEAKAGLEKVLARYSGPDAKNLPQAFPILARKVLDRIKEIESGKS